MATSWVHGTSMQTEYGNRLVSVRHAGPFARVEGQGGQNTWLHFPVPAAGGKVSAVRINFRTRSDQAWVHEVLLYDGTNIIAEHHGLKLHGDQSGFEFEVAGSPAVEFGLNVSVGVQFAPNPPTIQHTWIEFVAVGCDLDS